MPPTQDTQPDPPQRPTLTSAISTAFAERKTDTAGSYRVAFNHMAAQLDESVAQADADPRWFAGLPASIRTKVNDWRRWRARNPKEAA